MGAVFGLASRPEPQGANDETKAHHAFVYGDLRRIHRSALIACVYRASEWGHKQIELAAHDLLQHLDRARFWRLQLPKLKVSREKGLN